MSLEDITNIRDGGNSGKGTKRKRLSNGDIKQFHYSKPRKQFEIVFSNDTEKLAFEEKLEK
ncbi:hypothetical protein DPMN_012655 [Dreissena polymorpha]|uniref:Uncharacterized protein n=1 Tax=Dreissena polymorpha TaxID=45954 RepID=A0A9D4S1L4_DREPO|nr:hypothetical protein DPMN_012655 [Dreissena polymorpha]